MANLKPVTLCGVESHGMLCSEAELELSEDHDGIITFERINEMTGYGLEKVKKDVTWLLKSGYLINAVTDDEKVILWSESEYLDITCPTCGAVNSVRVGSSNKCKHCGSYLRRV